jgi:hypothetical protein
VKIIISSTMHIMISREKTNVLPPLCFHAVMVGCAILLEATISHPTLRFPSSYYAIVLVSPIQIFYKKEDEIGKLPICKDLNRRIFMELHYAFTFIDSKY